VQKHIFAFTNQEDAFLQQIVQHGRFATAQTTAEQHQDTVIAIPNANQ
jgi:hypothetical protein